MGYSKDNVIDFSPLDNLRRGSIEKIPLNAIGIGIAFIVLQLVLSLPDALQFLAIIPFVIFISCIMLTIKAFKFFRQQGPVNDIVYREFAAKNGLKYATMDPAFWVGSGSLFTYGHSQMVSSIFTGTYRDLPVSLFHYLYVTGDGKKPNDVQRGCYALYVAAYSPADGH
jgi:hypothetical protein